MSFEHISTRWDHEQQRVMARIGPGEYYVTVQDEAISTVLGSCVSACIRDPRTRVGGMNHFMLPEWSDSSSASWSGPDGGAATRFGNFAMEVLINAILRVGARREDLEVKLFGGGRMFHGKTDVGQQNIAFVRRFLAAEGLRVVAEDLGGDTPRRVVYFPHSGRARMMRLASMLQPNIQAEESRFRDSLSQSCLTGDIELF